MHDPIERFRLQVKIARDWDDIQRGDAPVSTFGLQVGHLSTIGEELISTITALRARLETVEADRDAQAERMARLAEMQAATFVNGPARTVYGQGYQAACKDIAEAARALSQEGSEPS